MPPRHRRTGSAASVGSQNTFTNQSYRANTSANTSSASLGIFNTSVNVATAFAGAQSSTTHNPPTTVRRLSRSPQPPLSVPLPHVGRTRMISPAAEMVAHSAQATEPVRYFLTAQEDDRLHGGRRPLMPHSSASDLSEEDESYGQEDAYVRQQQNAAAGPSRPTRRGGVNNNRYDADAWRPERADSDGDSGAGDEPVVAPRETRHRDARNKRKDAGTEYLGADLSMRGPRVRKDTTAVEATTPTVVSMARGNGDHTPLPTIIPEEPPSPPSFRREPTAARVMASNVSEGVAGVLLVTHWYERVARPIRNVNKWRKRNQHRFNMVLAFVALAAAVLFIIFTSKSKASTTYTAPTEMPASMQDLAERVVSMEGHLQGLTKKVNMEHRETVAEVRDIKALVGSIKVDVNNLNARQDAQGSSIKQLETDMAAVRTRMTLLEREIRSTLDDGRLQSALDRILPRHMPVRYVKGSLVVDPHFYAELKKLFVGTGEVESTVRKMIDGGVQTPRDQWSVNKYERELEVWADKLFDRWTADSKYIERAEFVELVHKELSQAQVLKDVKVSPGLFSRLPITIKTSKGEDITAALQALVGAALLRYSKDQLGLADYALFTFGGRVIPELTSSTLVLAEPPAWKFWFSGKNKIQGRSPATALFPDNAVGNCWPFAGDKGDLGIMLARRAVVNAVTVEHAAHELTLDPSTAPKTFEVWGAVDGEANQAKVKEYLAKRAQMGFEPENTLSENETPERVLLASFSYDVTSATPVQTFPVPADLVELGIPMTHVLFRIASNWGGDYTCLYRVRVHGEVAPADASAEGEPSS